MKVERYIRESCEHQLADTIEDFIGMAMAYEYAAGRICRRPRWRIEVPDLAELITRVKNNHWLEFRCQPAMLPDLVRTRVNDRPTILRLLRQLVDNQNVLDPEDWYRQFEELHPWPDGNGRVGSLLWNILSGDISSPTHPPDIWGQKTRLIVPAEPPGTPSEALTVIGPSMVPQPIGYG